MMTGPPLPPLTVITTCLATTRRKVVSPFPTLDNPKRKRVGTSFSRRGVRPESPEGTSGRRRDDGRRCGGTCRGWNLPSDRLAPALWICLLSLSVSFLSACLPLFIPFQPASLYSSIHYSIQPPTFIPSFFLYSSSLLPAPLFAFCLLDRTLNPFLPPPPAPHRAVPIQYLVISCCL